MEQAAIDLEDDLEMPRQRVFKPRKRPLLQRLRKQCVVSVCKCSLSDIPCFVPSQMLVVQKNPHQFRDSHRWMGVVELNGDLLGKRAPIRVGTPETSH